VSGDGGRGDGERPKRSWAEMQQYLQELDRKLFAKGAPGGAEGARLAAAVRAAQGTPGLTDACRAYLDAVGPPADAGLIAAFLDARERSVQLAALAALGEGVGAGRIALGAGLRAQLRTLAEGLDDELAEAAEAALAAG